MTACPEGAIIKNDRGVIAIDVKKCTRCGECVPACPYGMIEQYESGIPFKCDLCGGTPSCVGECNFGALVFKEVDKISRKLRSQQMKHRQAEGRPDQKRRNLAENLLNEAVRVPRTTNYMG
jgi:formate dehydrogenase iron-sulfur subunit